MRHCAFSGVTLTSMRRAVCQAATILAGTAVWAAAAQPDGSSDVPALLARIGERVEQYFARAQSIVCRETVQLQPLNYDRSWDGSHVRKLVYELRVAWDASTTEGKAPDATVLRELVSVDGRPPKAGDELGCLDPKAASPEPLAFLLPGLQRDVVFTWAGANRTRDRSVRLDFKSEIEAAPRVTREGDCLSFSLPSRGRVWVEEATANVLRLDTQLVRAFEFPVPKDQLRFASSSSWAIEGLESSIRYRAVVFHDPEETVMLPQSVETVQMTRKSGRSGMRISHAFSDYRRFITGARIVAQPR